MDLCSSIMILRSTESVLKFFIKLLVLMPTGHLSVQSPQRVQVNNPESKHVLLPSIKLLKTTPLPPRYLLYPNSFPISL